MEKFAFIPLRWYQRHFYFVEAHLEYSKNPRAKSIVGERDVQYGVIAFDQPCELGYHCPICKYPQEKNGNFDERLHWSEYNSFIWCSVCNKDYPSCLCIPLDKEIPEFITRVSDIKTPIDYATKVFLDSIEDANNKKGY